jgi:hypothetical protein
MFRDRVSEAQCKHRGDYWGESYQTCRVLGARAAMDVAFMLWWSSRNRADLPVPRWASPVIDAVVLVSLGTMFTYNDQIKRFWNEIEKDWRSHERMTRPGSAQRANGMAGTATALPGPAHTSAAETLAMSSLC